MEEYHCNIIIMNRSTSYELVFFVLNKNLINTTSLVAHSIGKG